MPKATDTRNTGCARTPTSRRHLLSGAAAALTRAGFAGVVLSPDSVWGGAEPRGATMLPSPDADLVATCHAFMTGEYGYRDELRLWEGREPTPVLDQMFAAQEALLDRMEGLRATTPEGVCARAVALAAHDPALEFSTDDPTTIAGRLLGCLVRDALAVRMAARATEDRA